jgi:Cupin-like domain
MVDPPEVGRGLALSVDARRWLAAACLLRNTDDQLVPLLVSQGWPEESAREELRALRANPVYEAAAFLIGRLQKLESIVDILHGLRAPFHIERRAGVARKEFLDRYYAENRPVILTDVSRAWPARRWTPEYLESVLGDAPVEVTIGRDAVERYDVDPLSLQHSVPFSEYAARIRNGTSNDCYVVANNRLLENPAAESLWGDLEPLPDFMAAARLRGNAFLWFGPGGTVTSSTTTCRTCCTSSFAAESAFA